MHDQPGSNVKPYPLPEAEITIPEGWKDRTVNSFVLPGEGAGSASFVITRDSETPAAEVQQYADEQLVQAAKALKGYKLVGRRALAVSGQPAVECTYTWTTPEGVLVQQRQLCIRHAGVFLIATLSARATDFPTHEETWGTLIQSLKLR